MDIVFIEQLSVITTIGVYDWEQTIEQKLVFDIEMAWDNRKAAKSDDVNDCLSYADISETVIGHVEGGVLRWWNAWRKRSPTCCWKNSTRRGCALKSANRARWPRGKRGRDY
jgi:dihydroneopterin aldolase